MAPVANTFLIGAQKSGTTYLAALLDQSPEVCVSDPKEPHFFTHRFHEGFDAYARRFADPAAPVRLDASTSYTFLRPKRDLAVAGAPGLLDPVPERIRDAAPGARFIYVMRDPVARARSAYLHTQRHAPPPAGPVSLTGALERDPMLVLIGRYADQIERYLDVFPRDRFLFLDFAELTADPAAVLARCCAFLGISAEGLAPETSERARHGAVRLTGPGRVIKGSPALLGLARAVVPRKVRGALLHRAFTEPAEAEFTDVEGAAAFFAEDRARVFDLTGLRI